MHRLSPRRRYIPHERRRGARPVANNMRYYKGGETVFNNHQMCDVTSELSPRSFRRPHLIQPQKPDCKIIDMLPGQPPQVTFFCSSLDKTCAFQFWTTQVESFYCALEECDSAHVPGWDTNSTAYACERVKCACVPGRFICGVLVSVSVSFC